MQKLCVLIKMFVFIKEFKIILKIKPEKDVIELKDEDTT